MKRIKRYIKIVIALAIPVGICYLIWANSFMVIIPPKTFDQAPDGVILWSYMSGRNNGVYNPDFIQEIDLLSASYIGYQWRLKGERKVIPLPYNRYIHGFVSCGISDYIAARLNGEDLLKDRESTYQAQLRELISRFSGVIDTFKESLDNMGKSDDTEQDIKQEIVVDNLNKWAI